MSQDIVPADSPSTDASKRDLVVKCVGLTKTFRDFWMRNRVKAVDRIDLDVRRGEVFGLLGPNGSGKSTTIKMILGLLHPTAGRIAVFNHLPRNVVTKQKIGYLPEESYLYPFLDARETLDYYGRLFHQHRRQRKQRTEMLLSMVGLDRVVRRPVGEYSKGMQRRIGLAQALINDPELLILDEPTTGLDPIGTRQIKDLIVQLAERGKTILLCSHLLADVEDVCHRVAVMFGGKVRRHGTVDELLTQAGVSTLQIESLSSEDVEAIEQALEARGKHIDRVEHPRQKLEDLFLQIVHEAQREGVDTSGARAGGAIASFLVGESAHMPESTDPNELLNKLVTGQSPEAGQKSVEVKEPTAAAAAPGAESPSEQKSVLDALTKMPGKMPDSERGESGRSDEHGENRGHGLKRESRWSEDADPHGKQDEADQSVIDSLLDKPKLPEQDSDEPNQGSGN